VLKLSPSSAHDSYKNRFPVVYKPITPEGDHSSFKKKKKKKMKMTYSRPIEKFRLGLFFGFLQSAVRFKREVLQIVPNPLNSRNFADSVYRGYLFCKR